MKRNMFCILMLVSLATTTQSMPGPIKLSYEGTWVTTNRQLDGTMTAVVTNLGENKWSGHFYGAWEGVPFSYNVQFSGMPERLSGTAVVDGANYQWNGAISAGWFKGTFGGDRYTGSFVLKESKR